MKRAISILIALCLLLSFCGFTAVAATEGDPTTASPEASPEVTPDPSPEVSPEVTPEPSPEASPEVTPEPSPEVSPEPSPEASPEPSPEASPEVTPEPSPEASPEVTPEPSPEASPEPSPEDDPVDNNALQFTDLTYRLDSLGVIVNIQGMLPAGGRVIIGEAEDYEARLAALSEVLPIGDTILLDIYILDANDELWTPESGSSINVIVLMDGIQSDSNIQVRHFIDTPSVIGSEGLIEAAELSDTFAAEALAGGGTVYYERCPVIVEEGKIRFSLSSFSTLSITNAYPAITIKKLIPGDTAPDQDFIFTISNAEGFSMQAVIKAESFELKDGCCEASVTICGLEGDYTVTEESWAWRYTSEMTSEIIDGNPVVTFTSARSNNKWFDFSCWTAYVWRREAVVQPVPVVDAEPDDAEPDTEE